MFNFQDIARCTQGKVLQQSNYSSVRYLLTDSRRLVIPASSLFFAICGERYNGHRFIQELYKKGVRQFVVEKGQNLSLSSLHEAGVIEVESSIYALQQVAACHRAMFSLPVIGITGSNGKTIIKEWLSVLLGKQYNIVKSPKSYNSQIGVPLSVWQINETHTKGIFEAGISMPGEMEHLEKIIRPRLGIFTNIGTAHDENFNNQANKIEEKTKLFAHCDTIIYCQDHIAIDQQLQKLQQTGKHTFSWTRLNTTAEVKLLHVTKENAGSRLSVGYKDDTFMFSVHFVDEASIENLMHCITTLIFLQIEASEIQHRLQLLQTVSMRLELKQALNGCYLIDDTYNNDVAGLTMALDFLNLQKQKPYKALILSDLLESGMPEEELYKHISELIENKGIQRLIGIGEVISRNKHQFRLSAHFFPSTESFLTDLSTLAFRNELILVKGARAFHFEQIVHKMQQKTHGTKLEINLDALAYNLNYYRSKLHNQTKLMVMVKAFAYGSGSAEIANFLQAQQVDYLAVAYADEGVTLRENGIHLPVMVMNPSLETFSTLLLYKLEPELYSLSILNEFIAYLAATNQYSGVHLKLDTGMHRLGFEENDLPQLLNVLQQTDRIKVSTILSHLAASDEAEFDEFSKKQIHLFEYMADIIDSAIGYKTIRHILNSAGISRLSAYQMDMVRLGIGLYGIEATGQKKNDLEIVGTLKTTISQIKLVHAGETVGYGRRGRVEEDTKIATIAIGYADGFDRRLGNGIGKVWIKGKLAPVIGSVCMDMCMVDITGIETIENEEVIVFGKENPIAAIAAQIGTIPYEILTGISERVKRVFYTS